MMHYVKIFDTFPEDTKRLTNEQRGNLVTQLVLYQRDGSEPSFVGNEVFLWDVFKAQLDRDNEKYDVICEKRRTAGANGGLAKASKCQQMLANASKSYQDKDKDKDKDKDIKKSIKEKAKAFSKPQLADVESYITSHGYTVDAQAFMAYYESVGWVVGNKPMKSWQSAVVTWQKREKQQAVKPQREPQKKTVNAQRYQQRGNDLGGAFRQFTDEEIAQMMAQEDER